MTITINITDSTIWNCLAANNLNFYYYFINLLIMFVIGIAVLILYQLLCLDDTLLNHCIVALVAFLFNYSLVVYFISNVYDRISISLAVCEVLDKHINH